MRYNQIVQAKDGTNRHIQHVDGVKTPDLWHPAKAIKDGRPLTDRDEERILVTWFLCHDLLDHVKRVCNEPDSP